MDVFTEIPNQTPTVAEGPVVEIPNQTPTVPSATVGVVPVEDIKKDEVQLERIPVQKELERIPAEKKEPFLTPKDFKKIEIDTFTKKVENILNNKDFESEMQNLLKQMTTNPIEVSENEKKTDLPIPFNSMTYSNLLSRLNEIYGFEFPKIHNLSEYYQEEENSYKFHSVCIFKKNDIYTPMTLSINLENETCVARCFHDSCIEGQK